MPPAKLSDEGALLLLLLPLLLPGEAGSSTWMVKLVSNYPDSIRPSCERHCAIEVSALMRKV